MEVACEVQVNLVHRQHLSSASSAGTALQSEHRSERRLTKSADGVLSDMVQSECQSDGHGGLSDSSLCRRYGSHKDEVILLYAFLINEVCGHFSHVVSVVFEVFCRNAILGCHFLYALELSAACYFDVCHCCIKNNMCFLLVIIILLIVGVE